MISCQVSDIDVAHRLEGQRETIGASLAKLAALAVAARDGQ